MQIVVNGATEAPINSKPLITQESYYPNVLTCLGCDATNPPVADLFRLYHQLEGHWLVASPIHWEATHNDAMITAIDNMLDLKDEESRLWFASLAEFLKVNEIEAFYHDPYTWLLKIDDKPAISSQSVYSMLHQSLMPAMNTLDKQLFWQRLITELQMYLSSHPLNNTRPGNLTINGLWFWGEERLNPAKIENIFTDDEILLKIPASTIGKIYPLPTSLALPKNSLLLIKYPHQMDMIALQERTQKNTVQWYWNNLAYIKPPTRWWSRLWRS